MKSSIYTWLVVGVKPNGSKDAGLDLYVEGEGTKIPLCLRLRVYSESP